MTSNFTSNTTDPWYESVGSNIPLTQGDIIFDCPIICWDSSIDIKNGEELESMVLAIKSDVIVMTQACDLENKKVKNVILCPHLSLDQFKEEWIQYMNAKGQTKLDKMWNKTCEDIKNGYQWQLAMLNKGSQENIAHRIVDFSEVYTLPRDFLESLLQIKGKDRLRLRPPYREHLSQAFARFFMRVGLPEGIENVWHV
jgi:hypothetical protein